MAKILIVDDDQDLAGVMEDVLRLKTSPVAFVL